MAGTVASMGKPSGIPVIDLSLLLRFEGPDSCLRHLMARANEGNKGLRTFYFRNFLPPPAHKFSYQNAQEGWFISNWGTYGELSGVEVDQRFEFVDVRSRSAHTPLLIMTAISKLYPFVRITIRRAWLAEAEGRYKITQKVLQGGMASLDVARPAECFDDVLRFMEL